MLYSPAVNSQLLKTLQCLVNGKLMGFFIVLGLFFFFKAKRKLVSWKGAETVSTFIALNWSQEFMDFNQQCSSISEAAVHVLAFITSHKNYQFPSLLFFLIFFCASACLSARGGRTVHTWLYCPADQCIMLKAVMVPLERKSVCLCYPESCIYQYNGRKGNYTFHRGTKVQNTPSRISMKN